MSITESTYSPKEVAQKLGFCTKTVLKLIKNEDIQPVYRINPRVIRIPESSIGEYLKRCSENRATSPTQRE